MENASKALLIAGAVLIVILLISVGIVIFNSSRGLFSSATSSMTTQEQNMFNEKFTMYEGDNVSGTQLRELIRTVRTNNINNDNPKVSIGNLTPNADTDPTKMPSNQQTTIPTSARFTVRCKIDAKTGLVTNIEVSQK